jgi:hypothetical protein
MSRKTPKTVLTKSNATTIVRRRVPRNARNAERRMEIMLKKIMGGLVALSFGLSLLAADDGAFIGTWKMNEAKSKATNLPEAKGFTLVITKEGETVTMSLKGIMGGQPISQKWTVPSGGGPLNFTENGPPAGVISVAKVIDDRTVDSTTTMNGKQISMQHAVVSADHKTMTIKESGKDEKGQAYKFVAIYERQ